MFARPYLTKHDFSPSDHFCYCCGQKRFCAICGEVKGHSNHPNHNYDFDEMIHAQDSEE